MSGDPGPELGVVVLAAGAGTRFGAPKQLAVLGGKPLIQHAIDRALEAVSTATLVVLGSASAKVARVLTVRSATAPGGSLTIVVNRNWREGIASSIRAGVAQLPASCQGALLLLADQPRITRESLHRVVDVWQRHPTEIVASYYAGTSGAPCVFPRWCFPRLLDLHGDSGARSLLLAYPQRVIDVAHPEAAADVDSAADLAGMAFP